MSALRQIAYEKYYGKRPAQVSTKASFFDEYEGENEEQGITITTRKCRARHYGNVFAKLSTVGLPEKLPTTEGLAVNPHAWMHQLTANYADVIIEPRAIPSDRIFRSLAEKWKDETKLYSSFTDIVLHPAYQRIIGLGGDVVPLILRDLHQNGGHWFWALEALTGQNPCTEEDAGRVKKMTQAWLTWGKENGLI